MKTNWWASILIFVSSYAPLALIIFIQDLDLATWWPQHPLAVFGIFGIAVFSVFVCLRCLKSIRGGVQVSVERLENRTNELVNYSLPYLVSFIALDLDDLRAVVSFLLFMGLMFLLTVRTQSLFINPMLAAVGYALYDAEFLDHGVHKHAMLLAPKQLSVGDVCRVERLSPFLLFVTEGRQPTPMR